jgi:hypothetical protein
MIALQMAAANPGIAGLIAALLYAATYFAFVRLLRFPRNWLSFRPSEITVTGFLAVLTIAWVSVSPDGPDLFNLAGLAVSTGFFVTMMLVIAAPAIAFQPANRVVEFLAKNAKYAGLWLIIPAVMIGFALPDIKLWSVLAIAMVIELAWFIRLQWERRPRRLYPLTASDRSVLEAQTKGNPEPFRARHDIPELEISGDDIGWRGCGKNTPPCPFNFYVNRLGLNAAPCCREHMRDISHYVATCLSEIGAVHWLEGGSLLGAVREDGQLLEWEDDIDISVLVDGEMTWDRLATGLLERGARDGYYVDAFEKEGLVAVSFDQPKPRPFRWERNRLRGEIRVDIAVYRPAKSHGDAILERRSHKGDMPATESGGYGVLREVVLPTSTIRFAGADISCPNKADTYLRVLYGDYEKVEYTYVDPAAAQNRQPVDKPGPRALDE